VHGARNTRRTENLVLIRSVVSARMHYRNVWSAAEMQAKSEEWQMVCANVFGLEWSQRLRAMMDVRSLSSL
jgi:hypothetical protein